MRSQDFQPNVILTAMDNALKAGEKADSIDIIGDILDSIGDDAERLLLALECGTQNKLALFNVCLSGSLFSPDMNVMVALGAVQGNHRDLAIQATQQLSVTEGAKIAQEAVTTGRLTMSDALIAVLSNKPDSLTQVQRIQGMRAVKTLIDSAEMALGHAKRPPDSSRLTPAAYLKFARTRADRAVEQAAPLRSQALQDQANTILVELNTIQPPEERMTERERSAARLAEGRGFWKNQRTAAMQEGMGQAREVSQHASPDSSPGSADSGPSDDPDDGPGPISGR